MRIYGAGVTLALVVVPLSMSAQIATSTAARDTADGCTVITVNVKSQAKNNIKDVHLCVAQTKNADSTTEWGDPIKDHYKDQKAATAGTTFNPAGLQTNVRGGSTEWCWAWTSGAAMPPNTAQDFSVKYCGGTGNVEKKTLKNIHLTKNGGNTFTPAADDVHSSEGHYPVFKSATSPLHPNGEQKKRDEIK